MKGIGRILVLSSVLAAAPAAAEDLREVLAIVYEANPTIRAERSRQDATAELPRQAIAPLLPQISANGTLLQTTDNQTTTAGLFAGGGLSERTFKLDTRTASVSAEQVLISGATNFFAVQVARARMRAGEAQLMGIEQQVLLEAATAYFDVARDTEVYRANASNVEVLLKQSDDARVRFELGDITRTDVLQADARLAGARAQLSSARTDLSDSRARFKAIVGHTPGELVVEQALPELPESLETALLMAEELAPGLNIAREDEKASSKQVRLTRYSRAPSVSFVASYDVAEDPSSFVVEDERWSFGLRAQVPIFQGGLTSSRLREAKHLNSRDRSRLVAATRNVEAQVTGVWQQLFEARARIASAEAQAEANRLALAGVRREAELGARTTLDVLNAEQEFLNATVSLASARRDERVAAYALLAAIGVFTVDAVPVPPGRADAVQEAADPLASLIQEVAPDAQP